MEDLAIEAITGKYFQHKLDPSNIVEIVKPEIPNFSPINGSYNALSAWSPIHKDYQHITLKEFDHYKEISKKEFEKVSEMHKNGLEDEIKRAFGAGDDYPVTKYAKEHKANLSANNEEGINYGTPKAVFFINEMENRKIDSPLFDLSQGNFD